MSYVLFVVASIAEYIGTFAVMFTLFRFPFNRDFLVKIALIAVLMSQVSYFTRLVPEIGSLTTFIQFPIFIAIFWLLFRVPMWHSLWINFAGLAVAFIVPIASVLAVSSTSGITLTQINESPTLQFAFQLLSAVLQIAIARTIYIRNWGFDWVPSDRRVYTPFTRSSAVITALVAFGLVLALVLTAIFRHNFEDYIVLVGCVFLVTLPTFIFFAIRKDEEHAAESSD